MKLDEIVRVLRARDLVVQAPPEDLIIAGLAVDSREVKIGSLFLAIRGSVADGHRFIPQAVAAGAVAICAEKDVDCGVPVLVVTDGRRAAEAIAEAWFGRPADALRIAGLTGTNGKTTTTALLRHLWNAAADAGSIGTLGAFDGLGNALASSAGSLTTPGPVDLQATLRRLVDAGVRSVVMEASSHALDQHRLDALTFAAGIFTNVTRDHLDYHGTMEQYLSAKLRLADLVASDGVLAVNRDDPAWGSLLTDRRTVSWGEAADAHLRVSDVHCEAGGSRFTLSGRFGTRAASLPFPGDFNVGNAAAAVAAAVGTGLSLDVAVERLATAPQVAGRMERLVDTPCTVLRDYAHTPDALERALATLRPLTPGRLIVVFGCGGDRDSGKRPMMGRVATAGADLAIASSDNPRTEDPERIIDDIVAGLPPDSYERESDRRRAIALALHRATPGDTVLLAGKGHETYQVIGTTYLPFDEREIVLGLVGQ